MLRDRPGGSTSRTYEPPRTYTRREVNAHNAKYAARKKKERKPAAPKEPAPDYSTPGPILSGPSDAEPLTKLETRDYGRS